MPLTYHGFFLGTAGAIDPTEGNNVAENASALVGQTYGAPGSPLADSIVTITAVNRGGGSTVLDQNNSLANDRVVITPIGGSPTTRTFDAAATYNATITYIDGSTASVVAVLFQTTSGHLYLAPAPVAGAPLNVALEAAPIRSITLDSLDNNSYSGLTLDRPDLTFPTCFARGTRIAICGGERPVEALRIGTLIPTVDGDVLPLRWISMRRFDALAVAANPRLRAVRIATGALAPGLPHRPLLVSQQHRLLVRSAIARRICGADEVLVPALSLIGMPGVDLAPPGPVEYWHFAFDRHAVVHAHGAAAESLYPGPMALAALDPAARAELRLVFPDLDTTAPVTARPTLAMGRARKLAERHARNARPLLCEL